VIVKTRSLSIRERGLNFEIVMWTFTRLSALAMHGLVLSAIIGALIMGARTQMNLAEVLRWGTMPVVTHVESTNVPDLAPWSTPFWRLMGSAMLLLAVTHGGHGVIVIADDYIVTPRGRRNTRLLSMVVIVAMSIIGVYVLWTS
jgi:succinate dehydrogenase hydrophobic anchor subunit